MSEDTITFDPLGTVTVVFDDQTYKLSRPKMGQWRYFQRRITEITDEAKETLNLLSADVALTTNLFEQDGTEENKAAYEAAVAKLREFAATPFYETSAAVVREMFGQLGTQPLPDALDDWPVWLAADVGLPMQIINHWKTAPKASGSLNGN